MMPTSAFKQTLLFALTAGTGSVAAFACLQPPAAVWAMVFWLIAISIAREDMRFLTVSHFNLLIFAVCGLLQFVIAHWDAADGPQLAASLGRLFANAAMLGLGFYGIAVLFRLIRRKDGLGLGDILLVAVAGLWMSAETVLWSVSLASTAALVLVLLAALRGRNLRSDSRIPFAAFLAPSLWFMWMAQQLPID